jgi:hypothetical protein
MSLRAYPEMIDIQESNWGRKTNPEHRQHHPRCWGPRLSKSWKEDSASITAAITLGHQTPPFQPFTWFTPVTLHRGSRPSVSDWGCIIGLVLWLPDFLDWEVTRFPGSPVCRWPLLDYPGSNGVRQSNKSPFVIIYIVFHNYIYFFPLVLFFQRTMTNTVTKEIHE